MSTRLTGTYVMQESIWDRYGGYSFVARTVRDFYDRVLVSRDLSAYFDKVNMEGLIEHQIRTIGAVMGGPFDLDLDALQGAHAHLRITDKHFNELGTILDQTLEAHGLEQADKNVLLGVVESVRSVIVTADARKG